MQTIENAALDAAWWWHVGHASISLPAWAFLELSGRSLANGTNPQTSILSLEADDSVKYGNRTLWRSGARAVIERLVGMASEADLRRIDHAHWILFYDHLIYNWREVGHRCLPYGFYGVYRYGQQIAPSYFEYLAMSPPREFQSGSRSFGQAIFEPYRIDVERLKAKLSLAERPNGFGLKVDHERVRLWYADEAPTLDYATGQLTEPIQQQVTLIQFKKKSGHWYDLFSHWPGQEWTDGQE